MSGFGGEVASSARPGSLDLEVRFGAAFAALALACAALVQFGLGPRGLISAALCGAVVLLAAFDLEQRRIPNRIVLPATGAVLVAQLALFPGEALEWIGAMLGAGLILYVPRLFKRDAVGIGDVKFAMLLGAGLGGEVVTALFFGSLAAAAVALWILIARGPTAREEAIPLGPFLAVGGILAVFLGELPS